MRLCSGGSTLGTGCVAQSPSLCVFRPCYDVLVSLCSRRACGPAGYGYGLPVLPTGDFFCFVLGVRVSACPGPSELLARAAFHVHGHSVGPISLYRAPRSVLSTPKPPPGSLLTGTSVLPLGDLSASPLVAGAGFEPAISGL